MDTCRKCGGQMKFAEKDTSSGRDIREYKCSGCGYSDWEDRGDALWKVLSDAREEDKAERAAREATVAAATTAPPSAWRRWLAILFGSRKE